MKNTVIQSLSLPKPLIQELQVIADAEGRSLSKIVVYLLREAIEARKDKKTSLHLQTAEEAV